MEQTLKKCREALAMLAQDGDMCHWTDAHTLALKDAVAVFAAERTDAERYRFLRKDFSVMGANIDGQHSWAYRRNFSLRGPTLDAAIDTAMGAPPVFGAA